MITLVTTSRQKVSKSISYVFKDVPLLNMQFSKVFSTTYGVTSGKVLSKQMNNLEMTFELD